jgi:hypothetical protein
MARPPGTLGHDFRYQLTTLSQNSLNPNYKKMMQEFASMGVDGYHRNPAVAGKKKRSSVLIQEYILPIPKFSNHTFLKVIQIL